MCLQNKYGDMLNQVTHMDTISRPVTSNSMYSMISKKKTYEEKHMKSKNTILLPESKYGVFLDSTTNNQAGSTWNVPSQPR
mmetsp:Transcript_20450/g.23607  ORF Transcript_20450/g.23607 Transcript_20450/m.23607 type:complete len:81 (-) Transcript_20450:145-387(-)